MIPKSTVNANKIKSSLIAQIVGTQLPLLPGESPEHYTEGLQALIEELGASTHMQVYLAQKMFDCMWEIRNYDVAGRGIIVNDMLTIVAGPRYGATETHLVILRALQAGDWDNPTLQRAMDGKAHTKDSLYAAAVSLGKDKLLHLQKLSAIRTKSLMQFQASYEALVNRPVLQERLQMQNELMKRDLNAVEVKAIPVNAKDSRAP